MVDVMKVWRRFVPIGAIGAVLAIGASVVRAQDNPGAGYRASPAFTVDGEIALQSLISLSDAHLKKVADMLATLASGDDARSCDWERIRAPLAAAGRLNVPAVYWFAEPDGEYWTITEGHVPANLASRPYFPRVLAGKTILGDLVVSRSTNHNTAIVAVPVRGSGNSVIGVLGASVYLDSLANLLRSEMGGLRDGLLFFAIDSEPLGALNSDESLIFTEPMKIGDAEMQRAFRQILSSQTGVVTYAFHGVRRTVLYRKSAVTGWWYGFGAIKR